MPFWQEDVLSELDNILMLMPIDILAFGLSLIPPTISAKPAQGCIQRDWFCVAKSHQHPWSCQEVDNILHAKVWPGTLEVEFDLITEILIL
jgi:hypothetical protein